jgi:hypothetical protein
VHKSYAFILKQFSIQIKIKGKNYSIGTRPTEEIAKEMANFILDNEENENVIVNAKKLYTKLKDENGKLRSRVPAGYYSKPDNIEKSLFISNGNHYQTGK